ncbi:hypothetical protein D9615_002192 [Tricholomella constricta]|uniref:Uncharacterized protein n=1 Tax=Tricholomella constricta TaxID=117010 RepID=A0A8H5HLX5_9AGAR|nr:hypothetical protein D9615_002192 [Tricholomella constricta]
MISDYDARLDPVLPPELERYIFEIAARSYPGMSVVLALVSRRVQSWIESYMYDKITLSSNDMCRRFLYAIDSRPLSFFAASVKSLCIPGDIHQGDALRVLTACQGVVNLAYWINDCRLRPPPFSLIASLRPERLSVNTRGLYGSTRTLDFTHPFFERVTHLEIVDWPWMAISLVGSRFEHLPKLTHLALDIDRYDGTVIEQLRCVLKACRHLRVLLCLVPSERAIFAASSALACLDDDENGRIAILSDSDVLDNWEGSLTGNCETCQWRYAEEIIEAKRSERFLFDLL